MSTQIKRKLVVRNTRHQLSFEREGTTGALIVADGENERDSHGDDAKIRIVVCFDDLKAIADFLQEVISEIEIEHCPL